MASPDALQEIILLNNWAFSRIRWARTLAAGDPRCRTLAAGALDCADQAVDMAAPQQFVRWRAWALANRGHALALLGRTDEAEWTYRQCIPLAEANVRVQVVAMAGLGRLLADTGRHEEGRSLLDEAYAKAPQDLLDISLDIVLESRAWLEARAGEFEQAMLWSRRCYERLEAQYRARLANVSQQVAVFAQMERERIEEMQRTEAAIAESRTRARETLLQDLHDGFGSQLTIARMRAERGALSNGEMIDLLDDCISDLYLVVDSIINTDGDLGEALRVLRNRLRGRLLGIETQLHWRVELGEALPLGHSRMIHVLRIVQEALANVLKHARAANAWVSAERDADGQLRVAIADDGTGFPEGKAEGNGLRGMRGRAEALSGTLSITSSGAGSRVELRLPV